VAMRYDNERALPRVAAEQTVLLLRGGDYAAPSATGAISMRIAESKNARKIPLAICSLSGPRYWKDWLRGNDWNLRHSGYEPDRPDAALACFADRHQLSSTDRLRDL